jgi:hypothetical protein
LVLIILLLLLVVRAMAVPLLCSLLVLLVHTFRHMVYLPAFLSLS